MKLMIMIQGPSDSPKFLKSKMRSFPTSLDVFWEPPSASSINGEFLGQKKILKKEERQSWNFSSGYILTYRNKSSQERTTVEVKDESFKTQVLL